MTGLPCVHQPLYTDGGIILCFSIVLGRRWDNNCRSSRPNQTRTLTFSWTSKFACKYIDYLEYLEYLDYLGYLEYLEYLEYLVYLDYLEYLVCIDYLEYLEYLGHLQCH